MNIVTILGTITKDIELKYTQSNTPIASFSIAYNKKWKTQDGTMQEKASFFDVTAFGKQGEVINQYFNKGSRILISGELEQQQWKAQDGTNRSKVIINLNSFDFIDKKESQSNSTQQGGYAPQQSYQPSQQSYQQPTQGYQPSQQQGYTPSQQGYQPSQQQSQQGYAPPPQQMPQQPPAIDVNEEDVPF